MGQLSPDLSLLGVRKVKMRTSYFSGFQLPMNEGAVQLRIGLENIQIVRVDWRRKFVELKICGVTWFDHRSEVVKAAQRYTSQLANLQSAVDWQVSAENNYYGTEIADPSIDADFSDAQENLRIVEARYDQVEQEFAQLFESSRLSAPTADLTIKHRNGQVYVVAKPTAEKAEQFINRIWDDYGREVIGFAFDSMYKATGYGNFLIVTPTGLDVGGIYPSSDDENGEW